MIICLTMRRSGVGPGTRSMIGVTQMVGGLGSRKSLRIVDLIATHGSFRLSHQCLHEKGKRDGARCIETIGYGLG